MQGGEGDVTSQFLQYRKMLNDIMPPRPRLTGYDLAGALAKGIFASQSEKIPSLGKGVGLGFLEFNKLQKEIDEANRKDRQSRDLTAFGMVTKKKDTPSAKALKTYKNDKGDEYQALLIGDDIVYYGNGERLNEVEFNEKFKGTNMRLTVASEEGKAMMSGEQFKKLNLELLDEKNSAGKLQLYLQSQKDRAVGFQLIADDFVGKLKQIAGDNNLTMDQLRIRILDSGFQGLIGGFRVETVGPGVMTEFDAERIIASLGGEPGALQNPGLVAKVLKPVFERKLERYNLNKDHYNNQVERFYPSFTKYGDLEFDESLFTFDNKFPKNSTNQVKNDDGSIEYVLNGQKIRITPGGIKEELGPADADDDSDLGDL
tara:strand:- start:529 stop:1644 length:1116 start_codon:yes stop_codon:yes gene_type:complete